MMRKRDVISMTDPHAKFIIGANQHLYELAVTASRGHFNDSLKASPATPKSCRSILGSAPQKTW